MTCAHCADKIERALIKLPGVSEAKASFSQGTVRVRYDAERVGRQDFEREIQDAGYTPGPGGGRMGKAAQAAASLAAIALLFLLLRGTGMGALAGMLPLAEAGMGYGMLFVIGLITSIHCVVMCGGINLSQCMGAGPGKKDAVRPGLLYNLGRVVSYTVFGALVGAVGSVVSFSGTAKGIVQAAAGVFMVIMGLNMTGLFPWLARLVPRMPSAVARRLRGGKRSLGPFYVGLVNGLMPCGPLQAMQIYALSTGNALEGALSMLMFSLGTVPLMFGLGALSSMMSQKFTRRAMAVGAVLVVALGLSMFTGGLSLAGIATPASGGGQGALAEGGVQKVRTTLESGRYQPITVTAGTPVEWTIVAPEGSINGCNNRIFIPTYGIEHAFQYGENVIRFTPDKAGTFPYSCWMGMITSTITVVEPGVSPPAQAATEDAQVPDWLEGAQIQDSCCS
jgi:sulfite exporter TauE/SafE/copper chaperone CopZ